MALGTWAVLRCFGGHAAMSAIERGVCLSVSPGGAEPTCTKRHARRPSSNVVCVSNPILTSVSKVNLRIQMEVPEAKRSQARPSGTHEQQSQGMGGILSSTSSDCAPLVG